MRNEKNAYYSISGCFVNAEGIFNFAQLLFLGMALTDASNTFVQDGAPATKEWNHKKGNYRIDGHYNNGVELFIEGQFTPGMLLHIGNKLLRMVRENTKNPWDKKGR